MRTFRFADHSPLFPLPSIVRFVTSFVVAAAAVIRPLLVCSWVKPLLLWILLFGLAWLIVESGGNEARRGWRSLSPPARLRHHIRTSQTNDSCITRRDRSL